MATVKIDQSAAGSTVQLSMGDQAQLTLPETRTAGYSWKVVSAAPPGFALADEGFQKAPGVGGTGTHRWIISAKQAGSAELELAYGRSWEASAGKKFSVTIVVQ